MLQTLVIHEFYEADIIINIQFVKQIIRAGIKIDISSANQYTKGFQRHQVANRSLGQKTPNINTKVMPTSRPVDR